MVLAQVYRHVRAGHSRVFRAVAYLVDRRILANRSDPQYRQWHRRRQRHDQRYTDDWRGFQLCPSSSR